MTERTAGMALWRTIETTLAAEIAAGLFKPGDRLPTEAELSRRFAVNRHTLRRAMAALADAGKVRIEQGARHLRAGRRHRVSGQPAHPLLGGADGAALPPPRRAAARGRPARQHRSGTRPENPRRPEGYRAGDRRPCGQPPDQSGKPLLPSCALRGPDRQLQGDPLHHRGAGPSRRRRLCPSRRHGQRRACPTTSKRAFSSNPRACRSWSPKASMSTPTAGISNSAPAASPASGCKSSSSPEWRIMGDE